MLKKWSLFLLLFPIFLSGCISSIVQSSPRIPINVGAKIAVIPFANYTETPLAGERAMSITAGELEARGYHNVIVYEPHLQGKVLFPGMNQVVSEQTLFAWARSKGARFVVTGAVNEWTYKVGLDGEPVVGVAINVIDLETGRILWGAVGSKSGGSRIAVSTVAQRLICWLLLGIVSN